MADSPEPERELDGDAVSRAVSDAFEKAKANLSRGGAMGGSADNPTASSDEDAANIGPWTCFHCGETFTTVGGARDHFGATPDAQPGCLIRVQLGDERGLEMELRKAEAEIVSLRAANEQLDYEAGHARAMEMEIGRRFKNGARSVHDAFNLFDSMEGRALAAEERAAAFERLVRVGIEEGWSHEDLEAAKVLIPDAVPAS